jgi:hypothetical protein
MRYAGTWLIVSAGVLDGDLAAGVNRAHVGDAAFGVWAVARECTGM